jgi:hypothetical protein
VKGRKRHMMQRKMAAPNPKQWRAKDRAASSTQWRWRRLFCDTFFAQPPLSRGDPAPKNDKKIENIGPIFWRFHRFSQLPDPIPLEKAVFPPV